MRIVRSLPTVLAVLSLACHSSPLDLGPRRVVGIIDAGVTDQQIIEAPAEASSGQSFTVTVYTFGNSCIKAAGAEVAIDGLVATITPYDFVTSDGVCLDYLKAYPRAVQLSFAQAGPATIRVKGLSDSQPGFVTVEHSLVVRQ
jgi:hypothetical protein